jgi:hypothetical protein
MSPRIATKVFDIELLQCVAMVPLPFVDAVPEPLESVASYGQGFEIDQRHGIAGVDS